MYSTPEDGTLAAVLHRYALEAPPRHLRLAIVAGALLVAVATWMPSVRGLVVAAIGVTVGMLGLWAWADRAMALGPRQSSRVTVWRLVRGLAAVLGTIAMLVTAFSGVSLVLGTWIS